MSRLMHLIELFTELEPEAPGCVAVLFIMTSIDMINDGIVGNMVIARIKQLKEVLHCKKTVQLSGVLFYWVESRLLN